MRKQGVIAVVRHADKFLVIQRSATVVAPLAYCFPGGAIEAAETEEAALRREMLEELRCDVVPLRRIWHSVTPWDVELFWWQAKLHPEFVLDPNPLEVAWCGWLDLDEVLGCDQLLESNRQFFLAIQDGSIVL